LVQVKHLNQALIAWEDMQFLAWANTKPAADSGNPIAQLLMKGSLSSFKDLRLDVMRRKKLDFEKYDTPVPVLNNWFNGSEFFNAFPLILSQWSNDSRRVYDLTVDFQKWLEITSIGVVSLNDVKPPFRTFAINLSVPINWKIKNESGSFDFIIVHMDDRGILIAALGKDFDEKPVITDKMKEKIEEAVKRGDPYEVAALTAELQKKKYLMTPGTQFIMIANSDRPIMNDVLEQAFEVQVSHDHGRHEEVKEVLCDGWKLVVRIVVGLCLHFEHHSRSKNGSRLIRPTPWHQPMPPNPSLRAIIDQAMICHVNVVTPLSPTQLDYHSKIREHGICKASHFVSGHYRQSYWRRPKGKGDDPNWPKTKFVNDTMVNPHKLPLFGLPVGQSVTMGA